MKQQACVARRLTCWITGAVVWVFPHEFVASGFGQWVEEPWWTTADDARGNIVQWIRIKFGRLGLLTIDGPESEAFGVSGCLATAKEQNSKSGSENPAASGR